MGKENYAGLIVGGLALALAGYAIFRKPAAAQAQADPTLGWSTTGPQPSETGANSDVYPYLGGSNSTGKPSDDPARVGPGETKEENLTTLIPGELIPLVGGDGSWYSQRKISEVLGWTPEQYNQGWLVVIGEKLGGVGPGAAGTAGMTKEAIYAYGYADTMEKANYIRERENLITKTGGSWLGGVLQAPAAFADVQSPITDYSNWLDEILAKQGVTR